jgi:hypothetical protein
MLLVLEALAVMPHVSAVLRCHTSAEHLACVAAHMYRALPYELASTGMHPLSQIAYGVFFCVQQVLYAWCVVYMHTTQLPSGNRFVLSADLQAAAPECPAVNLFPSASAVTQQTV